MDGRSRARQVVALGREAHELDLLGPSRRSVMNMCSACSIAQRRSVSECVTRSGVVMEPAMDTYAGCLEQQGEDEIVPPEAER